MRRFYYLLSIMVLYSGISSQTLDLTFTTSTFWSQWTPRNIMAVWLVDSKLNFIKTLFVAGGGDTIRDDTLMRKSLLNWRYSSNWDSTDAITSSTFKGHGKRHFKWDCKYKDGTLATDGNYYAYVEMSEINSFRDPSWPSPSSSWKVVKGAKDSIRTPANATWADYWDFNPYGKFTSQTVFKDISVAYYAPGPGEFEFGSPVFVQREGKGAAVISVMRNKGRTGAVSVSYATRDSTGAAGTNYTAASGTVSFADGEYKTKTFTIDILDDNKASGTKFAVIELSSPAGGAKLGTLSGAVLAIYDNDGGVPENGLVANWKFDEGAGTTAYDASGNGNHGVLYETKWAPATGGYVLSYDTNQAWMDAGSVINVKGPMTVSVMVFPMKKDSVQQFVVADGQWAMEVLADNKIHFGNSTKYGVTSTAANLLTLNAWHHLAAVVSATPGSPVSTDNVQVYLDGALVSATAAGTWDPESRPYGSVVVGMPGSQLVEGFGWGVWGFKGMLDNVYIYNRALTAQEVSQLSQTVPVLYSSARLSESQGALTVFVNPKGRIATIRMPKLPGPASLRIFDTFGKMVKTVADVRAQKVVLPTEGMASGVYVVRVDAQQKQLSAIMLLRK